jgi:immune inhibitor A
MAVLSATGAVATASVAPAGSPATAQDKPLLRQARDYWTTLAAPRVPTSAPDRRVDADRRPDWYEAAVAKHNTGFPPAARELARREAVAATTGEDPAALAQEAGAPAGRQRARVLTLLVEFNPNADDDFSGWERPDASAPEGCVTEPAGTRLSGPLHNLLPDPATNGSGRDNNTFWVPDFSRSHYDKLIYSEQGITKKVRKDLHGGVDIRGRTVRNFYLEMSKGTYEVTGGVTPWLTVPHSEAWYSADSCDAGPASDLGHPDNPRGTGQMAIDAIERLAATQPEFPWADFDVEDQSDVDGDGDLYEPNGVIDHVILVHAGSDQADGGGEQGSYAEWSSGEVVDPATGGHAIADTGYKIFNFTTQAEDLGVGVVAHEYGHDLGLPDLYDVIGPGDTDVAFWDLMSTGSHSGPLFQTMPAHMGAWSKYVLGWVDPQVLPYGSPRTEAVLGQASRPPPGTEDAVRIDLPDKHITLGSPHSGANAWWSNHDQSWADVRLTRSVDVPSGADVRFWSWDDYVLEELWDYGFIEVSTDGGTTWTQLVVRDEAGNVVSTNDDPNGRLRDYGGLQNGLTGDTGGYRHDYVDLTPYAGSTIMLRLRVATDAAFQERGWFADDFSLTVDGATVWSDDVESGPNGWTPEVETFTDTTGEGWIITSGEFDFPQYYLAEWRNFDGFDRGLRYPYATNFIVDGEWNVSRTPYNAPGLLLWYRDEAYPFNNLDSHNFDPPSIGSKGQLLLVDSHFEPERRKGRAARVDPTLLNNLPSRQQAMDVAFGPVGRYPFRSCISDPATPYDLACNQFGARSPLSAFTDARGWYPGIEYRPDLDSESPLFFRDPDASVVVPSRANEIYSTRIVDARGHLLRDFFGVPLGGGHVLGTGNPADGRPAAVDGSDPGTSEDLSLGVTVNVRMTRGDKTRARVRISPGHPAAD